MNRIKAGAYLAVREYLLKNTSQAQLDKVFDSLEENDRSVFSRLVIPVSWLDHGAYIRFLLQADKILGKDDRTLISAAVCYEVQKNFQGIYRIFLRLQTVEGLIVQSANLWRQFHDTGKATTKIIMPGEAHVLIEEYPTIPLYHEVDLNPSLEELGRLCGAHEVVSEHTYCMARGDNCCDFKVTWKR
ncbi:hypothetical protein JW933_06020 [candidate division FCPU426 bacterium]|nr:hypothetical protein [candidate division FCPU426 bacterium]